MIVDCVADLHGYYPELEGGDLLIVAGDLTARDTYEEFLYFHDWFAKQKYKKRIVIAGNHDFFCQRQPEMTHNLLTNAIYLDNESVTLPNGMIVYGSPWTPRFFDWACNHSDF